MIWGCVADDVTGATDLATNLVARGLRTVVVFGPVDDRRRQVVANTDADAVVVALKSRTAPVDAAVSQSVQALRLLRDLGAERFYFKYCSTFDSTARGNIGPVIDAFLAELGETVTIVVPSFPDTGRTVYRGYLFVFDELLAESPMRNHPLTPMTDSNLPRLLGQQSASVVRTVALPTVRRGPAAIAEALTDASRQGRPTSIVIDAIDNDDLGRIMSGAGRLRLITGGSGLALGIPALEGRDARRIPIVPGRRLVLSGSASQRTREQVGNGRRQLPSRKLDLATLRADFDTEMLRLAEWMRAQWTADAAAIPLVYSVDSPADVDHTSDGSSELVEHAIGTLARMAVADGVTQLIVAGGETSGRVVADLGIDALRIGPPIDAGVTWSAGRTGDGRSLDLALKSGNFGGPDMFTAAWAALDQKDTAQ